jgi:hypothetical protein
MNSDYSLKMLMLLKSSSELEPYRGANSNIEDEVLYDLNEIIESLEKILSEMWPKLRDTATTEVAGDTLFEIREELRHILYHIESSSYFSIICNK